MNSDEAHGPPSEHSVELTNEINAQASFSRRRILSALAVAMCLGGAIAIIVLAAIRTQRASEDQRALELETERREALRDGWKTLSAVAAQAASTQAAAAQPVAASATAAAPPAPTPALTNIVIVHVPAPKARRSVRMATRAIPSVPPSADTEPNGSSNPSPVYIPTPVESDDMGAGAVPGPGLNNGSIPGSQPNPTLPNGSPGQPLPGQPNGASNGSPPTQSLPSATVPASPEAPPLP